MQKIEILLLTFYRLSVKIDTLLYYYWVVPFVGWPGEDGYMEEKKKKKIQSVERTVAILNCFKEEPKLGLTEISKMVSLPVTTVFGIVDTLTDCGLLSRDTTTSKYQLGIEIYRLSLHSNMNLRNIVAPYLQKLVTEFGETANLVEHDNSHIIYVDKLESSRAMRICTTIGQRLPFYCSGVGRSILAFLPEEKIDSALQLYDYTPYTEYTVRNSEELRTQLRKIRQDGYCIDAEEFDVGIVCVGVPIFSPAGVPIGGISVSGPKTRMTPSIEYHIAEVLKDYAAQISKELYS